MPKGSKRQSLYHGLIIVDKPEGMTSQDVVNVVRRAAGTRRVGHTGTLDPLATGLMVILLGEATKLSEYLITRDKVYTGTMELGKRSNTYDTEGEVEELEGFTLPTLEQLQEAAAEFTGEIDQVPPPFSAVKIKGKKLYEYARAGEEVEAAARRVTVHEYTLSNMNGNTVEYKISCTSGTYVRSLVHELGAKLGCGALVSSIRRTDIEEYNIEEAISLDQIRETPTEEFGKWVVPMMDSITDWPIFFLNSDGDKWLRQGQAIPETYGQLDVECDGMKMGDLVFLCPLGKDAIAIGEVVPKPPSNPPSSMRGYVGRWLQPIKVLMAT